MNMYFYIWIFINLYSKICIYLYSKIKEIFIYFDISKYFANRIEFLIAFIKMTVNLTLNKFILMFNLNFLNLCLQLKLLNFLKIVKIELPIISRHHLLLPRHIQHLLPLTLLQLLLLLITKSILIPLIFLHSSL